MGHKRLGKSAIVVSDICMGTMTFGSSADEATSFRILDRAFDAGINFYDTAENYPVPPDPKWAGRTEEILGRWMKTKSRDALIIATKVSGPSHGWIKSAQRSAMTALDRHNIVTAVEASLKRLGTDYIDLYQTHWPDHGVAYDETMLALDELIQAGKVRTLATTNADGTKLLPGVPPIGKTVKGFDLTSWNGIFAPAGTPRAVVDKLNAELQVVLADKAVQEHLAQIGFEVSPTKTPEAFAKYVANQLAHWTSLIQQAGIPAQ